MGSKGLFDKHKKTAVTFDTHPAIGDMVWVDQTSGIMYNFDLLRNKWLASGKDVFEFARKGSSDGMYLPLLGDLDSADDVYTTGYPAVIVGVSCRSKSGEKLKCFDIMKNGESVFSFNYDSNLEFHDKTLNILIAPFDKINVYVSKDRGKVKNTVCRVELARRYDI